MVVLGAGSETIGGEGGLCGTVGAGPLDAVGVGVGAVGGGVGAAGAGIVVGGAGEGGVDGGGAGVAGGLAVVVGDGVPVGGDEDAGTVDSGGASVVVVTADVAVGAGGDAGGVVAPVGATGAPPVAGAPSTGAGGWSARACPAAMSAIAIATPTTIQICLRSTSFIR